MKFYYFDVIDHNDGQFIMQKEVIAHSLIDARHIMRRWCAKEFPDDSFLNVKKKRYLPQPRAFQLTIINDQIL